MPFVTHLLNPGADDLRRERRALLRALTQLHCRAKIASIDFGSLRGCVDRALAFLDFDESDKLPHGKLADRLEIIRDMIDDIRPCLEALETAKLWPCVLRVTGLPVSSPGSGAIQPMGPTTSGAGHQPRRRSGTTGSVLRGKKT